uniref:Uncharacterized protein n=1 Tax=Anguilla anguilla TaxID=7936 RepID=A0A0E9U8S4_ANGAN
MVSEDAVTAWLSIQLNGKVPFCLLGDENDYWS